MDILYKKLLMIKENPIIYFGRPSLKCLRTYINGYIDRQQEIDGNYDFHFYLGFQKYVQKCYNVDSSKRWEDIIESFSSNEKDAFDKFYEILDEFLKVDSETEEMFSEGTTLTAYTQRATIERHYTNHGNPNRHTNPHDHVIKWLSDDSYCLDPPINYPDGAPPLISVYWD